VARFTGFCCSARCPRAWRVGSLSSSKGQNNLSLMLKRSIGVLVGAALVVALLAVLPAVAQRSPLTQRSPEERVLISRAPRSGTGFPEHPLQALRLVRSVAADSTRCSLLASLSGARAMILLAASELVESSVTDDRYSARKLLGWVITQASLGIGAFPLVLAIIRAARRKSRYRPVYGGRAYATPFGAFGNLHAEGDPQEATRSAPSEEHKPHADSGNSRNGSDSLGDASRHTAVTPIARSRHRRLLRTRYRGAGRPPRDPTVSGARQSQVREGASSER
jgi:hypothetical protein